MFCFASLRSSDKACLKENIDIKNKKMTKFFINTYNLLKLDLYFYSKNKENKEKNLKKRPF